MPAQPLARVKTCPVLSIHEMEEQNVEETTHVIPSSTTSSGAEVAVTSRALDCLRVLTEGGHLCQNICHFSIEDQGNMHEDVEGFEAKVAKHIPTIVQNACTELLHLLPTVPSDVFPSLLPHLTAFTTHHLLAWIEILSLTSSLDVFLHRVPAILARLSQTSPLYQSFHNAYRMVRFYYGPISTNWAQIYRTALPLSPNFICTPIDEEAPSPITVASGRPADWGPLMCVWKDPSESVEARYAANGTLIVSVAGGMAIRVRDAVTGEVFHEWTDFAGARIQKFAVARNGRLLSYATEAGIFVLALEDASVPREIGSKVLDVDAMAFKDDGKVLAVATSSAKVGKVVFYHINSDSVNEAPQIISSILTEDPVLDLAFSTIYTAVVNACTQNAVTSFSFKKALTTSVSRFQKPESTITSAGMAHRGDFCAYGTKKGELFLWRKVDESCTLSFLSKYVSPVTSIKISENDQFIISSYENGTIILFDMPKGRKSVFDIAHAASISTIDISFSPYSEIITAAMDGTIRVWDTEGFFDYCPEKDPVAVKHSITRHEKTIQTVAISSNGRLVAASKNGTTDIMVWDLRRAQTQPRKLLAHVGIITCLAFSKTSGFLILASGSEDRTVRIWDPETGMEFFCCNVLAHVPRTLEFSLGGTHVQIGVETATGEKRMLDWSWRNGRQPTSMRTDSVRLRGQPTPNFHDYSLDIDHERGWITFRKTRPSLTDSNSTLTPSPSRILTWLDPRWRAPIALASVVLTPSTSSSFPPSLHTITNRYNSSNLEAVAIMALSSSDGSIEVLVMPILFPPSTSLKQSPDSAKLFIQPKIEKVTSIIEDQKPISCFSRMKRASRPMNNLHRSLLPSPAFLLTCLPNPCAPRISPTVTHRARLSDDDDADDALGVVDGQWCDVLLIIGLIGAGLALVLVVACAGVWIMALENGDTVVMVGGIAGGDGDFRMHFKRG